MAIVEVLNLTFISVCECQLPEKGRQGTSVTAVDDGAEQRRIWRAADFARDSEAAAVARWH